MDCITNTSEPLTVSYVFTNISPSLNTPTSEFPMGTPTIFAMFFANSTFEFAVKILIFFPCVIFKTLTSFF